MDIKTRIGRTKRDIRFAVEDAKESLRDRMDPERRRAKEEVGKYMGLIAHTGCVMLEARNGEAGVSAGHDLAARMKVRLNTSTEALVQYADGSRLSTITVLKPAQGEKESIRAGVYEIGFDEDGEPTFRHRVLAENPHSRNGMPGFEEIGPDGFASMVGAQLLEALEMKRREGSRLAAAERGEQYVDPHGFRDDSLLKLG